MNIKNKIVLFICVFALIFSFVSVSCFASVEELVPGNRYVPSLDASVYPSSHVSIVASFSVNGTLFTLVDLDSNFISFTLPDGTGYGFIVGVGWVDAQTISPVEVDYVTFNAFNAEGDDATQYSLLCSVLDDFVESDSESFYNQIFNSISGAVFGDEDLTSEQNLSLSLISTVFSLALVLMPVLLVIGFLLRCFRL